MLNRHITGFIKSLLPEEIEKFDDFIRSPFFNKTKSLIALWDELKKYLPEFEIDELEKEKVFKKIFPGKSYNAGTMKNLLHSFNRLFKKFLVNIEFNYNEFQQDYNLLSMCLYNTQFDFMRKKFEKIIEKYERNKRNEKNDEFNNLYLHSLYYRRSQLEIINRKEIFDKYIFKAGENLIYFTLTEISNIAHNIEVDMMNKKIKLDNNLPAAFLKSIDIDYLVNEIRKIDYNSALEVELYYYLYKSRIDLENDEVFEKTVRIYYDYCRVSESKRINGLSTPIFNICTQRDILGKPGSNRIKAEVAKYDLDNGLIISSTLKYIDKSLFAEYLKIFLNVNDFEYAEKFYRQHFDKLSEDEKDNINNLYDALKCLQKKEYNKSLEYISKINPNFKNSKAVIKNAHLKCYFELNDVQGFEYSLDAFRQYLYRDTSRGEFHTNLFLNYLTAMSGLFNMKNNPNQDKEEMKFYIENTKMQNKEYVLEKLKEIEGM